jgi:hypothetical protein
MAQEAVVLAAITAETPHSLQHFIASLESDGFPGFHSVKKYLAALTFGLARSASVSTRNVFSAQIHCEIVCCDTPNSLAMLAWCNMMGRSLNIS